MLKGKDQTVHIDTKQNPLSAVEKSYFSPSKDTLHRTDKKLTNKQIEIQTNTSKSVIIGKSVKKYTPHQLDSLFAITERRVRQINYTPVPQKIEVDTLTLVTDTISTKYSLYNFPFSEPKQIQPIAENFLLRISKKNLQNEDLQTSKIKTSLLVNKTKKFASATVKEDESQYISGKEKVESNLDGFTISIVCSLFIFSWIKMKYQKFIAQIIAGIVDYQIAMRLYRERNVLFLNVSLGLHFIFYVNTGLFVYYIIDYFKYAQIFKNNFSSIVTYSLLIFLIYNIKSLTSKLLGYIFLVQENFSQYIHNINLYNKNIGLFLFPVIIIYPFSIEKLKPFIIYFGLLLLLIMFLLRSYRSAQIIMRKGISLFYLILYLCAIEILPVLLLIKFTRTLIYN